MNAHNEKDRLKALEDAQRAVEEINAQNEKDRLKALEDAQKALEELNAQNEKDRLKALEDAQKALDEMNRLNALKNKSHLREVPLGFGFYHDTIMNIRTPFTPTNQKELKPESLTGYTYVGETIDKIYKNAYGLQFFTNGDLYDGTFMEDMQHGKGVYFWDNEDKYSGDFF